MNITPNHLKVNVPYGFNEYKVLFSVNEKDYFEINFYQLDEDVIKAFLNYAFDLQSRLASFFNKCRS